MGILEMDFERILGVPFFHSSSHSIMLWVLVGFNENPMKVEGFLSMEGGVDCPPAPNNSDGSKNDVVVDIW